MQGWIPRPLIIAAIVLVSVVELVFRVPDLLLIKERYDAQKAEYLSKLVLPDTAKAQLQKAEADADRSVSEAKAARLQPDIAAAQLAKAGFDATVARYTADAAPNQPPTVKAQLEKAQNDAAASAYQPDLAQVSLGKAKSEAATAALQPGFTKIQMTKLGIETQVALATLPANLQGAALSNNMMGFIAPFIKAFMGGLQQPSSEDQAPAAAEGSPPSRPQAFAPPAKAPVTGTALLTTDRFIALANAGEDAVARHDCATAIQKYNEGEAIMRSIPMKKPDDLTAEQKNQALRVASLRIFINNPQNCPGQSVH
jgi:hypothetical protein